MKKSIAVVLFSVLYVGVRGQINTPLYTPEEDATLAITQIIPKYGYPVSTYDVTTDDGYILTLIRIPHGKNSNTTNSRPVLVHHGMTMSADDWVITRPDKALSYILADAGYDVWLANVRGNKWSNKHVNLTINDEAFWNFSWHEVAMFDVPKVIDFILATTGHQKLHYVGFSMGTTVFMVLMSERPEYNDKILTAGLLAPVGSLLYTRALHFKIAALVGEELAVLFNLVGLKYYPGGGNGTLAGPLCQDGVPTQQCCYQLLAMNSGENPQEFNMTMLPLFYYHGPTRTSWKTFVHYGQISRSGIFRQYDYQAVENVQRYGSCVPPAYNLSRITAPVSIYHGDNDWLASPQDVEIVAAQLPNLVFNYRVPMESFTHYDFCYAIHVKPLVYDVLIQQLNKY